MADDHRSRGPQSRSDQTSESQYPPPPGEDEDRARAIPYHQRPQMATGAVTLPSIQNTHDGYAPQPGRGWDPRTGGGYEASPNSTNGYPPPGAAPPPHHSFSPSSSAGGYPPPPGAPAQYLPPVQAHPQDARSHYPPPPQDPRAAQYYQAQRPQQMPYSPDPYQFQYRPERGPPGPYQDYARGPGGAVLQQSAPRQRTSIACRYCRRRKIRCSGYQNSPGGKCTNCIKMNQECIFQPVSSSSSTAFVPVSALPNGVQPGMQLFGAYGQPINGGSNLPPGHPGGPYQASPPQYEQALPSPTGSFVTYPDERVEAGRRRQRPPEDDHGMRLPPPSSFPDDNHRRRSPSSSSSPNHLTPYPGMPPQAGQAHMYDNRTPPPGANLAGPPASGGPTNSVMSLGNIMDSAPSTSPGHDINRSMLDRLNGKR